MKFLDRKEQVLELQMTQYGKALMSRGVFQPAYYAFFDDDVVYDSEYMSTGGDTTATSIALENSVTTSDRIRDAIRPELQYNYAGVESWINLEIIQTTVMNDEKWDIDAALQALPTSIDNYHNIGLPMGTSEYNTSKAPAWKLNFHAGEITNLNSENGVEFYTGAGGLLRIPQLEVEAVYDIKIKAGPAPNNQQDTSVDVYADFPDGSFIKVEKGHILVDVGELNSIFENENFDIEVYEVTDGLGWVGSGAGIKENLRPLYFMKKQQADENLFDSTSLVSQQETINNVEYYFDVMVDEEIQENITITNTQDMQSVYDTPSNDDKEPC